MNRLFQK